MLSGGIENPAVYLDDDDDDGKWMAIRGWKAYQYLKSKIDHFKQH
jgi:hypothetical protein